MSGHTPGPWATSSDAVPDWHTQFTVYAEEGGERVATVFMEPANARLVAAAPDMLLHLQRVVHRASELCTEIDGSSGQFDIERFELEVVILDALALLEAHGAA